MLLDGQTAMITGAARALGESHAQAFAREGADLLLVDRCREDGPYSLASLRDLEHTATECRRIGSKVLTAVADVRKQTEVDAAVQQGIDEFGHIDVLLNNAGSLALGGARAHELSEEDWNLVIDVNLNGTWRCCRAVLPQMVVQRSGTIVNVASTGGRAAFEKYSSYVASRHAVIGFTKALALEYGKFGIRANAVCPSTVAGGCGLGTSSTSAVAEALGTFLAEYDRQCLPDVPERAVSAAEVSAAAVWLASPESSGTTGIELSVDGGVNSAMTSDRDGTRDRYEYRSMKGTP
jgi:NAD(P)-dependent dehydrogenase (short-subunit alcohol dehydrogenase family)